MLYLILSRYLFDPLAWVLYLMFAALVAEHFKRAKLHRALLGIAAVFLFALMILPLDQDLARPLEDQYPRPARPMHVDGIVILDGGLASGIFASRGVIGPNATAARMIAGADLARRFPGAKLVYSGTSDLAPAIQARERATATFLMAALGISPARVIWDLRSRDTGENLVNSQQLVHPKPGETWMLVTSAVHMPRAMAIASKLGWQMTPWPADYISTSGPGPSFQIEYPSKGLMNFDNALHEWVGLAVYKLTGRAR